MNSYRVETTESGDQVVFFENNAELLAYCLCEDIEIDNGVCKISGICDEPTALLDQALAAISRGHGKHIVLRSNGHSDVDGSY